MSTIERESRRVDGIMATHWIKEDSGKSVKDMTGQEVVDALFGNYDNEYFSNFHVRYYYKSSKRTIWNRLNLLWVWPVFLIVAPFSYIIRGEIGVNRTSKIGKIVDYLVKFE